MTTHTQPPPTKVADASHPLYEAIKNREIAILCGRNNSGKSFLLRQMTSEIGETASYLGPARYQNFSLLSPHSPQTNRKRKKYEEFLNYYRKDRAENRDNSPLNLQTAIAELTDDQRSTLFTLVNALLGSEVSIEKTIPENEMSQRFIQVDEYNLSYTSSGYRLVTTLLTCLLDSDFEHFLIDEPELGISPEVQGVVADFLFNPSNREKYFPHIRSITLATHSPIFLDRTSFPNNFYVERCNTEIQIRQVESVQALNSLQFFLLGNRFETLFLPAVIVLVEGDCDSHFLRKAIKLRFPESLISIIQCNGDGQVKQKLHIAREMLADLRKSPYHDRLFVVLDEKHGASIPNEVESMGVPRENIIIWDQNGIEHYYPASLLRAIFGGSNAIEIEGDVVSANGISYRKAELCKIVVEDMRPETELPTEIEEKLLERLERLLR
ncbi:ATP-dependent nuclease [Lentisalinibacter orientalis]|uniref:ATP-dependent nuclease n=1 Tax=Lentisalinibacter orientalis TaxID=2992241 RepID=UPI0038634A6B